MIEAVTGFVGPLLLGVIATMLVEAATGRTLGVLVRQRFRRRARRRLERLGTHGDLIRRADECLYTIEFVPDGWRHDDLQVKHRPRELSRALTRADPRHLPTSASGLLAKIEAERERLAGPDADGWNGDSLGVEAIRMSRVGTEERPNLVLTLVPSDFAAAQVCSALWQERFDADGTEPPAGLDLDRPVPGMVHAVGLNATVVTDDDQLILVRRSSRASSGRSGWHISVNEGMQDRDRDARNALDPHLGLVRGVAEELGVDIDTENVRFHTAMWDLRRYQFGLLGHVDLEGSGITAADIVLARRHGLAQDKFENSRLVVIPWTLDSVAKVLAEDDWVAHGWLNLVHSAISTFGARAEQMYELLGQEAPRRRSRR
ncbi:hypothetical protein H9657_16895 [Cellulomonas sp. Sa3CUA2]|uniref:Nudix hydrolase domain-containing protein n=1 Tax=Cellulomonas avistercoris TaxID=2762242 RepID=A0ABR8QHW7_9CELL|nr:hypothetical protein [Cellulomonas avistercoris]MBD7919951.1 hypothetical protein [Cellulomonas avistercoris]